MPVQLNATTGGGNVTITAPSSVTGTKTLTVPGVNGNIITSADTGTVTQTMLGTNVAGNGPAFIAYQSSTQSMSTATFVKIQFQTKLYDTNTNFDAVTNYRFTPTVAGFYQINAQLRVGALTGPLFIYVYLNGTYYQANSTLGNNTNGTGVNISSLVRCNGTTDYVEIYGYQAGGTTQTTQNNFSVVGDSTWFSASMVRSA